VARLVCSQPASTPRSLTAVGDDVGTLNRPNMTRGVPVRTDKAREKFLQALTSACNVTAACKAAGIGRQTAYQWREDDPNFALAWSGALEEAVDALEKEAWRRAHDGTDKPIVYQGVVTGTYREYSDRLMEILLKAHRPEKYIERLRTENLHAVSITIQGPAADL